MRYGIGKIGPSEGMALIAMLLLPSIYMLEPCILIRYAGNNAWLVKLAGGLTALLAVWLKLHCYQSYAAGCSPGRQVSFGEFIGQILGRTGAMVFFGIWTVVFLLQTALLLRQLADNTVLMDMQSLTPEAMVLLFSVCAWLLAGYGLEVLLRSASLFFWLGAVGIIVLLLGLIPNYNYLELAPWQGHGLESSAGYAFMDTGSWLGGAAIFFLASNLQSAASLQQAIKWGFAAVILLKTVILICLLMIFGSIVAGEQIQLFYEAVRTFHFSQYIQRIDGVFIFIWLTGGILSVTLGLYMAAGIFGLAFGLRDIKPLLPLTTLLLAELAMWPAGIREMLAYSELLVYELGAMLLVADAGVVVLAYYVFKRRNRLCQS